MKILSNLFCLNFVLLLSCHSADDKPDTLEQSLSSRSSLKGLKSIDSIASPEEPAETEKRRKVDTKIDWDDNEITREKIEARLEYKALILTSELPKVREGLTKIIPDLTTIIRDLAKSDFTRATDLSATATGVMAVICSTNTILRNLEKRNYANENSMVHVGLAIAASGALKNQFDQLIAALGVFEEVNGINLNFLKAASASIHGITKDIANPLLSEGDE
ncbi:MAG: hypothetical protein K2Y18_02330 [Alphaproteobacteria bacterium]|jgi:hypothetical protein|nr:hypothetical protein [Alphaproteobacteria bacterium]